MTSRTLLGATTALAVAFGAAGAMAAADNAPQNATDASTAGASTGAAVGTETTATGAASGAADTGASTGTNTGTNTGTSAGTSAGTAATGTGTGTGTTGVAMDANRVAEACLAELDRADEGRALSGSDLRTLYQAATIFARAGMEEACESVVEGIRDYGEQRAEAEEMDDDERAAYVERVRSAEPLGEVGHRYRAGALIGDEVVDLEGERVGDVDDVIISADGKARYVLLGTGGFLGMGEEYVPVDMGRLRFVDEDTLALAVDAETFEDAPRVETDRIDEEINAWANDVETWWAEHIGPQKASAE